MHVLSDLMLADIDACPVKLCIFCFTSSSLVVRYSLLALLSVIYVLYIFVQLCLGITKLYGAKY
jgi:uncharacterized membrane protein YcjF (UPF0283 family)